MIRFSPELDSLITPQTPELKFSASSREAPEAARFLIAVNEKGEVRYCFLQSSSGDAALDEQARKYLALTRFPAIRNSPVPCVASLTWGIATLEWGNDSRAPAFAQPRTFHAVIPVSLSALVTIYLLVFLAAVFLLWIVGEWNRRRRERRALRYRLRCVICAFEFEDRTPALLPRCPRCGSLNERFKPEQI